MLLAGLSSVWGITPSEPKTAPSEIFSQTLQIASDELPQVRQLQRTKPLLLYETASECIVVSNKLDPGFAKQLENGGSWLMTEGQYLQFAKGKNLVGRSDGQFMTSSAEINRVLAESGGDISKINQL